MTRLQDRVVLVTGGGSGIGRGICHALAEVGGRIGVVDLDLDAARQTAGELEAMGVVALAAEADVADTAAFETAVEQVAEQLGEITGLVNNAGILRMGGALEADPADWTAQFGINVEALMICSRVVVHRLIAAGQGGAIVNVASNAGKVGYPNMAAYNASKAAVISLTRSLAQEWAEHSINVNAVCPGGVDTQMLGEVAGWIAQRSGSNAETLRETMVPAQLSRHILPVEVGRVVAFLLSPDATIIRGQSINVDGGDAPY